MKHTPTTVKTLITDGYVQVVHGGRHGNPTISITQKFLHELLNSQLCMNCRHFAEREALELRAGVPASAEGRCMCPNAENFQSWRRLVDSCERFDLTTPAVVLAASEGTPVHQPKEKTDG